MIDDIDGRAGHLAWCKVRARQYLELGQFSNAVASMTSDLNKHPETRADATLRHHGARGVLILMHGPTEEQIRTWIDAFG